MNLKSNLKQQYKTLKRVCNLTIMSNLSSIKSVIKSTEKTKKITSAMELVAASKMAKTKKSMQQALPYAQTMRRLVSDIAGGNPEITHLFSRKEKVKRALYTL